MDKSTNNFTVLKLHKQCLVHNQIEYETIILPTIMRESLLMEMKIYLIRIVGLN